MISRTSVKLGFSAILALGLTVAVEPSFAAGSPVVTPSLSNRISNLRDVLNGNIARTAYETKVRQALLDGKTTIDFVNLVRPGSKIERLVPPPGSSRPAGAIQALLILSSIDRDRAKLDELKLKELGKRLVAELNENVDGTLGALRDYQSKLAAPGFGSAQVALISAARSLPLGDARVKSFAFETLKGDRIPVIRNKDLPNSYLKVAGSAHFLYLASGATAQEGLSTTQLLMERHPIPRLQDGYAAQYVARFPRQRAELFRSLKRTGLRVPKLGR